MRERQGERKPALGSAVLAAVAAGCHPDMRVV
jgi:ribulose kinase